MNRTNDDSSRKLAWLYCCYSNELFSVFVVELIKLMLWIFQVTVYITQLNCAYMSDVAEITTKVITYI